MKNPRKTKKQLSCKTSALNTAANATASSPCSHASTQRLSNSKGGGYSPIKKADLYLLGGCLLLALSSFFLYKVYYHEDGGTVVVTVDGAVCKRLPLDKNTSYAISVNEDANPNVLTIHDGFAFMTEAHCPDKLCMHQKKISKKGETIICLPRKIVISIDSTNQNDIDGISY